MAPRFEPRQRFHPLFASDSAEADRLGALRVELRESDAVPWPRDLRQGVAVSIPNADPRQVVVANNYRRRFEWRGEERGARVGEMMVQTKELHARRRVIVFGDRIGGYVPAVSAGPQQEFIEGFIGHAGGVEAGRPYSGYSLLLADPDDLVVRTQADTRIPARAAQACPKAHVHPVRLSIMRQRVA